MKTIKLPHLMFSLAMIIALAAIPMAPAHAMSGSAAQQSTTIGMPDTNLTAVTAGLVACRSKVVWRNGHRITIRVCHRVHRDNTQ